MKGALLAALSGIAGLFITPYMAIESIFGTSSFQAYWDKGQLAGSVATGIWHGRIGMLLVSLGGRHGVIQYM